MLGDYKDSKKIIAECITGINYINLLEEMDKAESINNWSDLKDSFEKMKDYKDSEEKAKECNEKLREILYLETLKMEEENSDLDQIKSNYERLGDYKDSEQRLMSCNERIDENIRLKKQKTKRTSITLLIAAGIAVFVYILIQVIIPSNHIKKGDVAYKSGKYDEAISEYKKAGAYKDAELRIHYTKGEKEFNNNNFQESCDEYKKAKNYSNAGEKAITAEKAYNYVQGKLKYEEEDYESAISKFENALGYEDAKDFLDKSNYYNGKKLVCDRKYSEAISYFEGADNYEDSSNYILLCQAEIDLKDDLEFGISSYEMVPDDFVSDIIDVANRKSLVLGYKSSLTACGSWNATSNYIESKQVHNSTGIWDSWQVEEDYLIPNQSIFISAKFNANDTICYSGSITFYEFTNYSSVQSACKPKSRTISFSIPDVTEMPSSYQIAGDTTLYYSDGRYSIEKYKSATPYSGFTEYYSSTVYY